MAATHLTAYRLIKQLAVDNLAVSSFQCGPGPFFASNPPDESFPMVYMEEEQLADTKNASKKRSISFWVLDRTLRDEVDEAEENAKTLDKCENIANSLLARIAKLYPNLLPEPYIVSQAAVGISGADRCYGYRTEIVLEFVQELNICAQPYNDMPVEESEFTTEFSFAFAS